MNDSDFPDPRIGRSAYSAGHTQQRGLSRRRRHRRSISTSMSEGQRGLFRPSRRGAAAACDAPKSMPSWRWARKCGRRCGLHCRRRCAALAAHGRVRACLVEQAAAEFALAGAHRDYTDSTRRHTPHRGRASSVVPDKSIAAELQGSDRIPRSGSSMTVSGQACPRQWADDDRWCERPRVSGRRSGS